MARDQRPSVIDLHAHMLEPEVLRRAAGKTVISGYGANPHGGTRAVNETTFQKRLDPERQLEDRSVSPTPWGLSQAVLGSRRRTRP